MKKVVLGALALLLLVTGVIWTLQGLGYLGGSSMTGEAMWAIIGPIFAGFGVALLIVTFRGPGSSPGGRSRGPGSSPGGRSRGPGSRRS